MKYIKNTSTDLKTQVLKKKSDRFEMVKGLKISSLLQMDQIMCAFVETHLKTSYHTFKTETI